MSRESRIAEIVRAAGAQPILSLATQSDYDFSMSIFELFVLKSGEIVARYSLEECLITFTGDECTEMLLNVKEYRSSHNSRVQFSAKVPSKSLDDSAFKFAALSTGQKLQDRSIAVGKELWQFWQVMLDEFKYTLTLHNMWNKVAVWNKYHGPRILSPPHTPEYRSLTGRTIGAALFAALDTFLTKEFIPCYLKVLRGDQWGFGQSPSIHVLLEMLEEASKIELNSIFDCQTPFSKSQMGSIKTIKKELKKYPPPSQFWKKIVDYKKSAVGKAEDAVDEYGYMQKLIAKQSNEEKIITYITTARNAMAHNRDVIPLQKYYLSLVGFTSTTSEFSEKVLELSAEALDVIFNFLLRMYTEVFGMESDNLLEWREQAKKEAETTGDELKSAFDNADYTRTKVHYEERNLIFRQNCVSSPTEHKCQTPDRFDLELEERLLFKRFCEECGGQIHVLLLKKCFEVELVPEGRQNLIIIPPTRFVATEGFYGHTEIHVEIPKQNERTTIMTRGSGHVDVSLKLSGEVIWNAKCQWAKVQYEHIFICKTLELFALPIARIAEISMHNPGFENS